MADDRRTPCECAAGQVSEISAAALERALTSPIQGGILLDVKVRALVKSFRGDLRYEPEQPGSTFIVELAAVPPDQVNQNI